MMHTLKGLGISDQAIANIYEDDLVKKQTEVPMKEQLLKLVDGMEKDGYKFEEHAPVFHWKYEENPGYVFTMRIDKLPDEIKAEAETANA